MCCITYFSSCFSQNCTHSLFLRWNVPSGSPHWWFKFCLLFLKGALTCTVHHLRTVQACIEQSTRVILCSLATSPSPPIQSHTHDWPNRERLVGWLHSPSICIPCYPCELSVSHFLLEGVQNSQSNLVSSCEGKMSIHMSSSVFLHSFFWHVSRICAKKLWQVNVSKPMAVFMFPYS